MSIIISIVPIVLGSLAASSAAAKAVMLEVNSNKQKNDQSVIELPTNIRNEKLLRETLENMGARNIHDQKLYKYDIDNFHIDFVQDKDQTFKIRFVGDIEQEEAMKFKNELTTEYGNVVQNYVYETLKRKAEDKAMKLEK